MKRIEYFPMNAGLTLWLLQEVNDMGHRSGPVVASSIQSQDVAERLCHSYNALLGMNLLPEAIQGVVEALSRAVDCLQYIANRGESPGVTQLHLGEVAKNRVADLRAVLASLKSNKEEA